MLLLMLGLQGRTVRLWPYTPQWQERFEAEKARLQCCLGHNILDIQHIGSTSIPDMIAKPILDIGCRCREL
jgi:GrpB-like predicted nucleotidyltransferase (UPF0157 family)